MKKKINSAWGHIKNIITNPKQYFTHIVADGNIEESMLKAFIYGLIGGCLVLGMRLLGGATVTLGAVFTAIVIIPVLAVLLLFVGGGLMMLVAEITGGERDWEIAIKGLASVFFIYPVVLVLNALAFNCSSMWIISILVDTYLIFLFYNMATYCMRCSKGAAVMIICIIVLFLVTVYATDYRVGWFMLKNTSATLACML